MKNLIAAGLLFFGASAQAALVDNGSFTTDTGQGLDWLDLSETSGLSYSEALAANTDWRLATNSEVEALFSVAFDGFISNSNYIDDEYFNLQEYGAEWNTYYREYNEDILNWIALFGFTYRYIGPDVDDSYSGSSDPYVSLTYGIYQDENNDTRRIGTYHNPWEREHTIYGMDSYGDYASVAESGNDRYGVFLVKASVVPIPPAFILFGSALAGLGWMKRKKTA